MDEDAGDGSEVGEGERGSRVETSEEVEDVILMKGRGESRSRICSRYERLRCPHDRIE